ncbi:DUF4286 family protein [Xanthovirga aplysinae]|uniref:DUF4286 family protein n=1 Tax=Xanthovirga aplysinae TaxID=2529853 RepID=UPI0012BD3E5A|nr:DUF4286 family protein [Xanthovirga aplysinae]MTI30724.1 DUF4286 family protein [Xanthovirga aplysinae]
MIIYEVNATIINSLLNEYIKWLEFHIQKRMLPLEGFESARYFIEENNKEEEHSTICIQYQLSSRKALDNYFKFHVEEMRTPRDGLEFLEEHITRHWRILRFVNKFEGQT